MLNLKLEAPWYTYQKKVKALFENDPDINVGDIYEPENCENDYAFDIEVKNHDKFMALSAVMHGVKEFGNIRLGVVLYDEENSDVHPGYNLFSTIFKGNRIVKDLQVVPDQTGTEHVYVRFQPEVVQFFDDDLSDFSGNWNGLAEDIARDVFDEDWSTNFCTADLKENTEPTE